MNQILARLAEPSTWAGLAAILIAAASGFPGPISGYLMTAAGIAGAVGVVLREAGTVSQAQIVADVLAQMPREPKA